MIEFYLFERDVGLPFYDTFTIWSCTPSGMSRSVTQICQDSGDGFSFPARHSISPSLAQPCLTDLAWHVTGRAAEELVYGADEMTTINQKKLELARGIAVKLVVSGAMTDSQEDNPRVLSIPFDVGLNHLKQILPREVGLSSSSVPCCLLIHRYDVFHESSRLSCSSDVLAMATLPSCIIYLIVGSYQLSLRMIILWMCAARAGVHEAGWCQAADDIGFSL